MLRIQSSKVNEFLANNKYDVMQYVAAFIPDVVKKETDVLSFVRRILHDTQSQGTFSKTFEHSGDTRNKNIRAFAMFLLEEAGRVKLWDSESESHARIDTDGNISTYQTDIPQIEISWQTNTDTQTFQCIVHYVEGDSDIAETWKL